jgi:hypothetical protein
MQPEGEAECEEQTCGEGQRDDGAAVGEEAVMCGSFGFVVVLRVSATEEDGRAVVGDGGCPCCEWRRDGGGGAEGHDLRVDGCAVEGAAGFHEEAEEIVRVGVGCGGGEVWAGGGDG